jgi:hypothetical protein
MMASVADGLYVGDKHSSSNLQFLSNAGITIIINLTDGPVDSIEDVDIVNYILPSQELLDDEVPKMFSKLDAMASYILTLRKNNKNILIQCEDGRNKSILVAGYYLICTGTHYAKLLNRLEMLYFTAQQRLDEQADLDLNILDPEIYEANIANLSAEKRNELEVKRAERRALRCLTMLTYHKLLRKKGGAKK